MLSALFRKFVPDTDWEPVPTSRGLIMRRRINGTIEEREPTPAEETAFLESDAW